ncbi:hypothetical protein [Brevibacillus daliensis]|uniref:hypothetical protein n=1 Tax=Brevibacillus daliensis TaxID=2892995 RepID=UPI001E3805CD|nr:hypothetical protein [Brevibacillus daliensis]
MTTIALHQQARKMQVFYWILFFEMLFIWLIAGLAMVIGSGYIIVEMDTSWKWASILLIPIGLWSIWKSSKIASNLIQRNNQESTYELHLDRIIHLERNSKNDKLTTVTIPFTTINQALVSFYLKNDYHLYKPTALNEPVQQVKICPMIVLRYSEHGSTHLTCIRFIEDSEIDPWLKTLHENKVQLEFSIRLSSSNLTTNNYILDILDDEVTKRPFIYSGNFAEQMLEIMSEKEKVKTEEDRLERERMLEEEAEQERFEKYIAENGPVKVGKTAWLTFILHPILAAWLLLSAQFGWFTEILNYLPFLVLLFLAIIFFTRVERLAFRQIIFYWVTHFVAWVWWILIYESGTPPRILYAETMASIVLLPLWVVAPYFIAKKTRKLLRTWEYNRNKKMQQDKNA